MPVAEAACSFATISPPAWLFGGMTILQLEAQAAGLPILSDLLTALPYVATIFVAGYYRAQPTAVA